MKKKITVAICMSPQLAKWLRQNALKNKRSISGFATILIEKAKDMTDKKKNTNNNLI